MGSRCTVWLAGYYLFANADDAKLKTIVDDPRKNNSKILLEGQCARSRFKLGEICSIVLFRGLQASILFDKVVSGTISDFFFPLFFFYATRWSCIISVALKCSLSYYIFLSQCFSRMLVKSGVLRRNPARRSNLIPSRPWILLGALQSWSKGPSNNVQFFVQKNGTAYLNLRTCIFFFWFGPHQY
jgi:hypothetical protein